MKIVGLLTGRGQNTLKDKNVLEVSGKPVMFYPANAAIHSKYIQDHYVSSDDEKILSIAEEMGYQRIVRPKELARPEAQHVDAILHALGVMKLEGIEPDILVCLLANNVTIQTKWIDDCIQLLMDDPSLTAVVPVYQESDHHPLRAKKMNADGVLSSYIDTKGAKISTNRQDLTPCYFLSHNFWVMRVASSIFSNDGDNPWVFMGNRVKGYMTEESIDVHREVDLLIAENWINSHKLE